MRIARTTTGTTGGARRSGRAGGGQGFAPTGRTAAGGARVGGAGVLASIDALTALQGVDGTDAADPAGAATARGAAMLDDLELLRDGLLTGEVDDGTLERLRHRLGERRRGRLDPGLEAVLDDIEVRAAVELAKRERGGGPSDPPAAEPPVPQDDGATAGADAAVRARRAYGGGPVGG